MQWPLLYECFDNHIMNQREKLLNGSDIYGIHFQGDGATIKDTPLLNIFYGGVCLPVSVQKIVECAVHIKVGHKKGAKFFVRSFFNPMNDLDPEKKLVDLHMFGGASVCRKYQNILNCVYPMLSCIVGEYNTCHNVFKGW